MKKILLLSTPLIALAISLAYHKYDKKKPIKR